ncbi:unnamed protein product [Clonostachys rosea f. rosea IK726]|uniref:Uncharacterized protein n=2 Tax=Bionectria ochroleuca TaxID=29856 RepID=A0A0B7KG55_BIOOC|nr:unnamed protein product [Clonostachys rosea f. rosea IK726]
MSANGKYASKLVGKRVLIIGGTAGIGLAVAEASVELGAVAVVISSSNAGRIDAAVSHLQKSYPTANCNIMGFKCDLKQEELLEPNIAALFDASTSNGTEKLDHIVFTAGDHPDPTPISEIDFNFIKEAGLVRLFAPLLIAKYAAKHVAPGLTSSFTLTSGISAYRPYPNWNAIGAYVSSSEGLMRSLAVELKPLRVNLVCLGPVDTDLMTRFYPNPDQRKAVLDAISQKVVTGAIGQAKDVAEAFLYCMKDYNLSGSVIHSNAGILLV